MRVKFRAEAAPVAVHRPHRDSHPPTPSRSARAVAAEWQMHYMHSFGKSVSGDSFRKLRDPVPNSTGNTAAVYAWRVHYCIPQPSLAQRLRLHIWQRCVSPRRTCRPAARRRAMQLQPACSRSSTLRPSITQLCNGSAGSASSKTTWRPIAAATVGFGTAQLQQGDGKGAAARESAHPG